MSSLIEICLPRWGTKTAPVKRLKMPMDPERKPQPVADWAGPSTSYSAIWPAGMGQSCYIYLQIDRVVTSVFIGGELQIDQVVTSVFIGGELQIYQVVTSVFIGGEAQVGGIMWTPTEIGQVVNQCFIGGEARMSKRLEAVSKRNKLKVSYITFFKLLK